MKKYLISLLILFILLSTAIVGFSHQIPVPSNKTELALNDDPLYTSLISDDTPGIQWEKYYGKIDNSDEVKKARQTSDGGYILVGETQSYTSDGAFDAWLIKTDKNGFEEWNHTYGEIGFANFSHGISVQQTNDGGFIFIGLKSSLNEDAHGWVVKTTVDGTEEWNRTYNSFRGECIQQTTDGGYIISGESVYMDTWLCRIDENGNVLWEQMFYIAENSFGYSVQQTEDEGFIVTGLLGCQEDNTEQGFLIKTDASGNEQWNKTYGFPVPWSGFYSVQVLPDGYVMAGFTNPGNSNGLVWFVRTDEWGNMLWNRTYSLNFDGDLKCFDFAHTNDNGFVLTGSSYCDISFGWILKTDDEGNQEWQLSVIETYPQEYTSIQETTDGSYIVAGISYEDGQGNAVLLKIGHIPHTSITRPTNAFYLFDKEKRLMRFPFIIGLITIEAEAYDSDYEIKCVKFFVDETLQSVDYIAPYTWKWTKPILFFHTLKITAVNEVDNCSSSELIVLKFL